MAWRMRSNPKTTKVSTRMAREWAEMDAAHTDRPLSERRLQVYRKMLADGKFRPVTWAKVWCEETGQSYRVNGKHTSNLLSEEGALDGREFYAVVEDYEADTLADVANLYSTFDSRQQTRTTGDINRSFASTIPELAEVDQTTINLFVTALAYHANPSLNYADARTPAERAEALFDNVDVCQWLLTIISHRSAMHLRRAPVVAAMIGTWHKNRADATRFWEMVRDDTGPTPDAPDRKLSKWLILFRVKKGSRSDTPNRFKVGPREFYVKSILAWNAWRKNESTNLNYHHDAKIPALK